MKSRNKLISVLILLILVMGGLVGIFINSEKKEIINIGYQSITAQTWSALIVKSRGTFDEKLKKTFPDRKIEVIWHNELSGSAINNNMLVQKYQLGYMGDMLLFIENVSMNLMNF